MSMIPRTVFSAEHEDFRKTVRRFFAEEIVPHHEAWEEQGWVDRSAWLKAGEMGFLCTNMPEEYGGSGADRRYATVLMEEQTRAGSSGIGWSLHSDIVAPYILRYGSKEQKTHYLPKLAKGEMIGAIAMTEPGTGSDLQSIKTTLTPDGEDYLLSGSKIFITNGYTCDLVIVAARMGASEGGAKNITLALVEAGSAGFTKGKPLKKVGMKSQDTCELFFDNVKVSKDAILGGKTGLNMGFVMLMQELAWERLMIAITSVSGAAATLAQTLEYTKQRKAFGKPVSSFQNTRFKLAEMTTEVSIAQVFVDRCLELELQKKLTVQAAAAAKYWCSDLLSKVVDECVQLHGGYGYMLEYPVARAYIDSRAQRIYGGTNEIMKELIARTL